MTGYNFHLRIAGVLCTLLIAILWLYRLYDKPRLISEIPSITTASSLLLKDESNQGNISIAFDDEVFIRGITHRHTQKKDKISSFEDSLSGGVCVADFNNDGWDDLFFITGSGNRRHFGKEYWWQTPVPNQLYLNQSGKYFINATQSSGITESSFGIACAVSDLNKDGFIDIIVANKGENFIYHNIDGSTFNRIKTPFDKEPTLFSTSILIYDFNKDGNDDILFGNYVIFSQEQNVLELNAGFDTQKITNFDPALYDAQPDTLYLNKGNFSFEYSGDYTKPNKHGRTLSFFESGSILALNDKGSPSEIISSDGKGGRIESVVLNARDAELINTPTNDPKKVFIASDAVKGGLYAITMDHQLNDTSWDYGVNRENRLYSTWAVLKGDFNIDGYEDVFLSNGLIQPHPDTNQTSTGQPNILLMANPSIGEFSTYTIKDERVLSSRGAATLDINNDGKLDIVINNNNDFPSLLVNKTSNAGNWLGFRCYPDYLCQGVSISINGKEHNNIFNRSSGFASMSGKAFITAVSAEPVFKIVIKGRDFQFSDKVTQDNVYYTVNIESKRIETIDYRTNVENSDTAVVDREEFIALLRQGHTNPRLIELTGSLSASSTQNQHLLLDEIAKSRNKLGFPLAEKWAKSTDEEIALKSIEVLRLMEAEESVPSLINLLKSGNANIRCAAAKVFEYFYWKDEAVTERKHWAESSLIKLMSSSDPSTAICAIDAIAESESYRGLAPLLLNLESDNSLVAARSARALGMIRQTEATTTLKRHLVSNKSPFVKAEALLALVRLKADLSDINLNRILVSETDFFKVIFQQVIDISDDGVNANYILKKEILHKHPMQKYFENLNYSELFMLYGYFLPNQKTPSSPDKNLEFLHSATKDKSESGVLKIIGKSRPDLIEDEQLLVLLRKLYTLAGDSSKEVVCGKQTVRINYRDSSSGSAASTYIADSIRNCINAGFYNESKALANFFSHSNTYPIGLNELLDHPNIQQQEKFYMLINYPISIENLKIISTKMSTFTTEQQLSILRALELKVKSPIYIEWLKGVGSKADEPAIKFFISGRLTSNQMDVHHE